MAEELRDEDDAAAEEAMRSLRAALSVAPSHDFADRVRRQVAQGRRRGRRQGWVLLAAAAAVLAATSGVAWRLLRAPEAVTPRIAAETAGPARSTPPVSSSAEPAGTPPRTAPRPAPRAEARVVEPARRPPVRALVPRGEAERLARYVAQNRRHPRTAESLPATDPGAPLAEPPAIVIAALEVAPIVSPEGSFR